MVVNNVIRGKQAVSVLVVIDTPATVRSVKLVLEDEQGRVGDALRCADGAEGLKATAVVHVDRDAQPQEEPPPPPRPNVNVRVDGQTPSKRVVKFSDGRTATVTDA